MRIRKATVEDVDPIQELIQQYAAIGLMLPRTAKSLYEHLQNFTVAEHDGIIVGTVGLHVLWKDLAEVRSLAVSDTCHGQGIGRKLVEHAVHEAETLGIEQVLSLTYQTDFFTKLGFEVVQRDTLPRKVWKDCVICKKFDRCDEIAMIYYTQSFMKVQPLVEIDTSS
ncbi:N-acetyltransferase [Alicyclobacillus ferrooxydans]|uniref:Acetyltransferase n=1 Tax=Alicyclobacillus ferrooxydans TaxID=471514 RepID=A0A0P9CIR7_9BACL|nr:N-acetyltransferase [Alicyclobacillus ferrooxydans]KPV45291.1 acetyltransferase [Alicyclobacillus ferrooxydans]